MTTEVYNSMRKMPLRNPSKWRCLAVWFFLLIWQLTFAELSFAAGAALSVVGIEVDGRAVEKVSAVDVFVSGKDNSDKRDITIGSIFAQGDEIVVPPRTVLVLHSANTNDVRLQPGCRFKINVVGSEGESYGILVGKAFFKVSKALNFFNVDYMKFLAIVHGTEFDVAVEPKKEISFHLTKGKLLVQREVKVKILEEHKETEVITSELLSPVTKSHVSYRLDVDEYLKEFKTFKDAEEYYRRQLEEDEKSGEYERVQEGLNAMGKILITIGKPKQALAYFERALKAAHDHHDESWNSSLLNHSGIAYDGLGDYRKAIEYHEKSLALSLKLYPSGVHPEIAASYNNLGNAYNRLGDYRKEIEYHEKSLAMMLKLYPSGVHPDIATSYNNLGNAYYGLGDYRKAIEYYEKSLALKLKLFPEGVHPNIVKSYRNLSKAWRKAGDAGRATEYENRAQAVELKLKK